MTGRLACLLAFMLPAWTAICAPQGATEALPPEVAFTAAAAVVEPSVIEVRYRIESGHYLYRNKFSFHLTGTTARPGPAILPSGIRHRDEFFGEGEIYRGGVLVRVPLDAPLAGTVTLKAVSQGCADAGLCYPPQTHLLRVTASGNVSAGVSDVPGKSAGLLERLGKAASPEAESEFLPVEQAFRIQARMPDARTVVVRFTPAESYYLYREKIHFRIAGGGDATTIESVQLPRGEMKKDPTFGDTEVFHQAFQAAVRIAQAGGVASAFTLVVGYQGCSEKGLCYPPETRNFDLHFAASGSPGSTSAGAAPNEADAAGEPQSEDQRVASLLGSGNFWLIVASFLGFGLLLSLTPCMWPMIPILSGIVAGQGGQLTRLRGFLLAAAYVAGLALTYAIAGIGAGLTGTLLSSALQNAWVLVTFAMVFVALALAMFGLYDLQLPSSLQGRLSTTSGRLKGGTLTGVFLMGALSAVIVGPCVAAPLAGALLYISQSGDTVLGGSALFAMGLGMGLPLLAIGTSAGALLPRAGPWMQGIKNVFGVLLLGTAIWLVSPVIPATFQMGLWAALLTGLAVYLRAIDSLPPGASGWHKLSKAGGVLALLLGIAMLIGAMSGAKDVLRPLAELVRDGSPVAAPHPPFRRIATTAELDVALGGAGRPVMLDFYADWCVSCKEMERFTFSDPGVARRMEQMLLLQADVTANSAEDKALLARFGLFGPPGIIFFDSRGNELRGLRVIGYQSAERFSANLDRALGQ
jgi:thioredoxin:protein disulfide reductase